MAWGTSAGEHFLASNPASALAPGIIVPPLFYTNNPVTLPLGPTTQPGTPTAPTPSLVWRYNAPAGDTQHGAFDTFVGGALFQQTFDRVLYYGYNAADGGGALLVTEPSWHFCIESDYDDGATHSIESYFEYARGGPTTVADGVTTNASPTVTSATFGFLQRTHVGMSISGTNIPANSYIGIVNSATSIGLSSSNLSNVPRNATGSGTGITLTIGPSGATGLRPIFMRINRANADFHFEINSTTGFSFSTLDGTATQWGALGPTGLTITPLAGQVASLDLGAATGGGALIMRYGGAIALTISPQSANDVQFQLAGGVNVLELFTSRGISVNVQDNTAAFTVKGASAGGLVAQIRAGATAGDLMQWQETGGTTHIKVTQATSAIPASLVVGKAALATTATDGFLYLPTCAGTPTGVPTTQTGTLAHVYDTTAHKLWVYDAGWKGVVVA